ncbi:MAG: right-handed parallel beta-helix repeat-containing protein [Candidatus Thermoplasmatota archaeon]
MNVIASSPPPSGDWVVDDITTISNTEITLNGSLIVRGSLTLTNVDLKLNAPYDGAYRIEVENNAKFYASYSVIENVSYKYLFIINNYATVKIDNTTLKGCGYYTGGSIDRRNGLYIDADSVTIENSLFKENYMGLIVNYSGPKITYNRFENNYWTAIYIKGGKSSLILRDNIITSNVGDGIALIDSFNSAKNNSIKWSRDGIYVSNSIGLVEGNELLENSEYGIYVTGTGPQISENKINGNGIDGIRVYKGTGIISNNNIEWNAGNGIYCEGSSIKIESNTIFSNGLNGIRLFSTYGTISENIVENNLNGIYLTNHPSDIINNSVINSEYGLFLDNTNYVKETIKNIIVRNCVYGINLNKANVPIIDSLFALSRDFDIYCRNSTANCYNTLLNKDKIAVIDTGSVKIYWYLDVAVIGNNEIPVNKANVKLTSIKGLYVDAGYTDINGWIYDIPILQFAFKKDAIDSYNPYQLTATWQKLRASTSIYILKNTAIKLCLIDALPPSLTIISPKNDTYIQKSEITIFGKVEDLETNVEKLELSINSPKWVKIDFVGTNWSYTTSLPDGRVEINVRAFDKFSNLCQLGITVFVDTKIPVVRISKPRDGYTTSERNLTVVGSINENAKLIINGRDVSVVDGFFSILITLNEGINTINVYAEDMAGNLNIFTITVYLDIQPPKIIVERPANNSYFREKAIVLIGKSEKDVSIKIILSALPENRVVLKEYYTSVSIVGYEYVFSRAINLEEGKNFITVIGTDKFGKSNKCEIVVTLDTKTPPLIIYAPLDGEVVNKEAIEVRGASEIGAAIQINNIPLLLTEENFSTELRLSPGKNKISMSAKDVIGNSYYTEITVILDTTPPNLILPLTNETEEEEIYYEGKTDSDAIIFVNGIEVQNYAGTFNATVKLAIGENIINIVVKDSVGNKREINKKIIRNVKKTGEKKKEVESFPFLLFFAIVLIGVVVGFGLRKISSLELLKKPSLEIKVEKPMVAPKPMLKVEEPMIVPKPVLKVEERIVRPALEERRIEVFEEKPKIEFKKEVRPEVVKRVDELSEILRRLGPKPEVEEKDDKVKRLEEILKRLKEEK